MNLRIPGPTPCPPEVLSAVGRQMINHRGPEFKEILRQVTENLKKAFQTKNDVVILTSSGTGGMEAAVASMLSPGERTVVVSIGVFGDRFGQIAQAYGADVVKVSFPFGTAADPAKVREALAKEKSVKTVFVTHNETSTGVTNDLAALAGVIKKEFNKNLVVDGISSIGSIDCPVDTWGIDIAVTGSQKGWMTPPGLSMLAVSPRAWEAIAQSKMPRFYLDLAKAKKSFENGETPYTPAISIFYGLQVGLELMLKEGLENTFKRHARIGAYTRKAVKGLGLTLYADERFASNTVTSIKVPAGVDWKKCSSLLRQEHGVVLAGGQANLSGQIFRIGHLGLVSEADIDNAIAAIRIALPKAKAAPAGSA